MQLLKSYSSRKAYIVWWTFELDLQALELKIS